MEQSKGMVRVNDPEWSFCTSLLVVVCALVFRLKSMGWYSWGRTCDFQSTSLLRGV